MIRDLATLARQLPDRFASWLRTLAISAHYPVDVGTGQPWCLQCQGSWPCDVFIRLEQERS